MEAKNQDLSNDVEEKKIKIVYKIFICNSMVFDSSDIYFKIDDAIDEFLNCVKYFEKHYFYIDDSKVLEAVNNNISFIYDNEHYFNIELKKYSFDEPKTLQEIKEMSDDKLNNYINKYNIDDIPEDYIKPLAEKINLLQPYKYDFWISSMPFFILKKETVNLILNITNSLF